MKTHKWKDIKNVGKSAPRIEEIDRRAQAELIALDLPELRKLAGKTQEEMDVSIAARRCSKIRIVRIPKSFSQLQRRAPFPCSSLDALSMMRKNDRLIQMALVIVTVVGGSLGCGGVSNNLTSKTDSDDGGADGASDSAQSADGSSGGCVAAGDPGDNTGIGEYCSANVDCSANPKARTCARTATQNLKDDFCTFPCPTNGNGGLNVCGAFATCVCQGSQCLCTPNACQ